MATVAAAINQVAGPKTLDASLWWDSSSDLLNDLERLSSSDSNVAPSLANRLKINGRWLLETVALFKPPNPASKEALNATSVNLGSHNVVIRPELRNPAIKVSDCLGLDELQSYLLLSRFLESNSVFEVNKIEEYTHLVLVSYYQERQCLLKCLRQILMLALSIPSDPKGKSFFLEEAQHLVDDGLEEKIFTNFLLLVSSKHPEFMAVEFVNLWAEETLIEVVLTLEILFLLYYEPFHRCSAKRWKNLCSLFKDILSGSQNIEKLAVSAEAAESLSHVKIQLFLILLEALELDNLLQMVHNEVPFRQGNSTFSYSELLEMDTMISGFNPSETAEAGPLFLSWGIFLCLISSLPEKDDSVPILDVDHTGYVRQAFEAAPLEFFLEILRSNMLKDLDALVIGYRSVLKTCIAAFIASYDLEDNVQTIVVDVLCEIYHGQGTLCMQFWDKDSFVDGPIRCLLLSLQEEFPQSTIKLVRLLSALCEGEWPAECVCNYLDKIASITMNFEVSGNYIREDFQVLQAQQPIAVPGIEGLVIPTGTMGQVLKVGSDKVALVRWEFMHSGMLILLLRLACIFRVEDYDEASAILYLLGCLFSSNKAVASYLMGIEKSATVRAAKMDGHLDKNVRIDLVKIICKMLDDLVSRVRNTSLLSLCVTSLTKLLTCCPHRVLSDALKTKIFELGVTSSCSGLWLLSGGTAKIPSVLVVPDQESYPLIVPVLDLNMQLVKVGVEDEAVSAFVVFCLRYVLVNHENWKYSTKDEYWKVKLKVFDVLKNCLVLKDVRKLGSVIRNILVCDSSMHGFLLQMLCTTADKLEKLHMNRLYRPKEIEGLEVIICLVLDIMQLMLSDVEENTSFPIFQQAVLRATSKPVTIVSAVLALACFRRNSAIQVAAARVLSRLCVLAEKAYPHSVGILSFVSNDHEVRNLSCAISDAISSSLPDNKDSELPENKDLFLSMVELLISATIYQGVMLMMTYKVAEVIGLYLGCISWHNVPAFLASLVFLGEDAFKVSADCETDALGMKRLESTSPKLFRSQDQRSLINSVLKYIVGANDLIKSHPEFLLKVLQFLRALWRGGTQYVKILEMLKDSKMFWKHLSAPIMIKFANQPSIKKIGRDGSLHLAYVYQCQSTILWIMSCDALWKQKLSNNGTHPKDVASSDGKNGGHGSISTSGNNLTNIEHIISEWHKESSITSLIKSYVPSAYDKNTIVQAKMAGSICIAHLIKKHFAGEVGCLSLTSVNKIQKIAQKLTEQPMFLELQAQRRLDNLGSIADLKVQIMSDLCHHIHGELDMLHFSIGPLRELSQFLLQLNPWQSNNLKHPHAFQHLDHANYLFDTTGIHTDLGLDSWLTSDWKESKAIAENMLSCMEHANLMAFVSDSQVAALRSLTLLLCVYKGNSQSYSLQLAEAKLITYDQSSSRAFMESSVEYLCKFSQTADILEYSYDSTEQSILEAQSEILLHLVSGLYDQVSSSSDRKHVLSLCLLVIKSAASNLKALVDVKSVSVVQKKTVKYLLTLILLSAKFIKSLDLVKPTAVAGYALGETPMVSLGLLPVLCRAVENAEYCDLSLATIDVIISGFLASNSWLPVLQKHLRLHHIMQLLQQVNSSASISTTLKFLLTLARVRGGAEMLWQADFISFLKVLLSSLETNMYLPNSGISNGFLGIFKEKGHDHIWELGMAVLAAMIHSLGDDSSSMAIVEEATSFFFLEKPHLISCLCAPHFATDDQDKKRARIQKSQTSLVALKETEHTLILICELSKHPAWSKTMSLLESQLRERIIHLLAFISKGIQNFSESLNKMSFFCPPTLKEEREFCTKPSSVQSKYGWLSISARCSSIKDKTLALPCIKPDGVQGKAGGEIESAFHTYFSYLTAIQIYRISALLLRFLCMQAIAAAKSAEDVGLIDFAHFPELPMPEILHGLQDQAISIVTELLESERATVSPDVQTMCLLLLQIMEKALYLELCVSQTCGMRPVSARVEDFFKEIKGLIKASEGHKFLEPSLKCVKQIIVLIYPELLQVDGISW
ncbi:uncharacterized protein LOC116259924 isoform X2 [Nymphaea colorata]|uniref:uncharacterized protein LOC116259924 isoform X2 n=1 Tax=Nymphaea colorata TaxID=210225 RepID=UPI00129DEB32|nr:uncharacterized protein LOC116259924 isoform X2 [Nymphaea colorata]